MKTAYINIDEAGRLDIQATQGRSFSLTLDLGSPTANRQFNMQVRNQAGGLVLEFYTPDGGITTTGNSLVLTKTPAQMQTVATGVHNYDLVEFAPQHADNRLFGSFIVTPAITAIA